MKIPFTKAHGARNDFLLTWSNMVPEADEAGIARAICDRHEGIGADGWIIVTRLPQIEGIDAAIRLYNSDGSDSEISGNGTRCAAAFLLSAGFGGSDVALSTGAGTKRLRVLERSELQFVFEMDMGTAVINPAERYFQLPLASGSAEVTILNVGNPQCAMFVSAFDLDWRATGRAIENHPHFPRRTNVSFVKVKNRHELEVRFWERGAGETESSGTGSTGAVAAALERGLVDSPVTVHTAAGPLSLRVENESILLTGPAEITAGGEYYWNKRTSTNPYVGQSTE